jgi:hypothetical protein
LLIPSFFHSFPLSFLVYFCLFGLFTRVNEHIASSHLTLKESTTCRPKLRRIRAMSFLTFNGQTPKCHAESWVAPSATLIGDVELKKDASIWFGVTIRVCRGTGEGGEGYRATAMCCTVVQFTVAL